MLLSIIIPYYNVKEYTDALLLRLAPQITPEVEVILVDDASPEPFDGSPYPWLKVVRHKKNKGAAGARNTGLTKAKGEYIQFIDADDMIPDYFIARLFQEIAENPFDVCDYSWKSLDSQGMQVDAKLANKNGRLHNPSVCTRCFNRAYIGKHRFNTRKDSTEDEDFTRHLGYMFPDTSARRTAIPEYMYFYRTAVSGSKSKNYEKGLLHTKRIVYYFSEVTTDMTDLLEEVKVEDRDNEVFVLTERCDIPELRTYCQLRKPFRLWAHEARGEHCDLISIVKPPLITQVVMWCEHAPIVGGISTFVYSWCYHMRKYYDIIVLYEQMDTRQINRLRKIVQVERIRSGLNIVCDTLIVNRLNDRLPENVSYKRSVQVCHANYQTMFPILKDRDILVNVSESSKASWGEDAADGVVIHNMIVKDERKALLLVSATRIGAGDKNGNDTRMMILAQKLSAACIPFVWLNFSDNRLEGMPHGFINMGSTDRMQSFIAKADYLVQLSGSESWSYSCMEALVNGTPVICTPFDTLNDLGIVDGVNAHVVPFDMDFDVNRLLDIPVFEHSYDCSEQISQWRDLLGRTKPKGGYVPPAEGKGMVRATQLYYDLALCRNVEPGEELTMSDERIETLTALNVVKRI